VRALVQRVSEASVWVEGERISYIGPGLLVLLGIRRGDGQAEAERMVAKLLALRIFEDEEGRMNLAVRDTGGQVLCVSQFTLYGDTRKGRRPTWAAAAPAEQAEPLVDHLVDALRQRGARVETGRFRAQMVVSLDNDGPVTLIVETAGQRGAHP
jgi:D-aminoacyl-tRNA deacylase